MNISFSIESLLKLFAYSVGGLFAMVVVAVLIYVVLFYIMKLCMGYWPWQ